LEFACGLENSATVAAAAIAIGISSKPAEARFSNRLPGGITTATVREPSSM
jgi:hypothetical protein